jgi:short subunit dehydrogenase-like uncharacterized protein
MCMWMLYGATGYTGKLLVEEAVARGHRPLLAGRSEEKLRALAARHNLDYVAFGLDHHAAIVTALRGMSLVLHAAGPFAQTSAPMLDACLSAGVHYLDITGEIGVFEHLFAHDQAAKDRGIALIPGVGFDVVPSDCLIRYVSEQLPDAISLEVALDALSGDRESSGASAGTMKSGLGMLASGNKVRRNGELVAFDLGAGVTTVRFPHGERLVMPIPWGDLSTGYRTSGIPNITTYMALPLAQIALLRRFGNLVRQPLKFAPVRDWLSQQIDLQITGPTEQQRQTGRCFIYVRVTNRAGKTAEAWLETPEAYHLTAKSALLAVERVHSGSYQGALSPALAFGADFVLEIENTRRLDAL